MESSLSLELLEWQFVAGTFYSTLGWHSFSFDLVTENEAMSKWGRCPAFQCQGVWCFVCVTRSLYQCDLHHMQLRKRVSRVSPECISLPGLKMLEAVHILAASIYLSCWAWDVQLRQPHCGESLFWRREFDLRLCTMQKACWSSSQDLLATRIHSVLGTCWDFYAGFSKSWETDRNWSKLIEADHGQLRYFVSFTVVNWFPGRTLQPLLMSEWSGGLHKHERLRHHHHVGFYQAADHANDPDVPIWAKDLQTCTGTERCSWLKPNAFSTLPIEWTWGKNATCQTSKVRWRFQWMKSKGVWINASIYPRFPASIPNGRVREGCS